MDYGRVTRLDSVDWNYPPDDPRNGDRLVRGDDKSFRLWVGLPQWGHPLLVKELYPKAKSRQLTEYAKWFPCLEFNGSYHQMPTDQQWLRWTQQVPADFHWILKCPQVVTHHRDIGAAGEFRAATENLFPRRKFAQFPPHADPHTWGETIKQIQTALGSGLALEFRHPGFFKDQAIHPKVADWMAKHSVASVITDTPGERRVVHSTVTSDWVMIRLMTHEGHPSDEVRIRWWLERLLLWKSLGLKDAYLFIHDTHEGRTLLAVRTVARLCHEVGMPWQQPLPPAPIQQLGLIET